MKIRRVRRTKNDAFTTINNAVIRDRTLSLKAKGILVTVMGLPDSWDFSVAGLIALVKEGKQTVYHALKELEQAGYVERLRVYEDGKITHWEYVFHETPNLFPTKQEIGLQEQENLEIEKRPQYKKHLNQETINKDTEDPAAYSAFRAIFPDARISLYQIDLLRGRVTDLAAWQKTLSYWAGNGYKPTSIDRLCSCYEQFAAGTHAESAPTRPPVKAPIALNAKLAADEAARRSTVLIRPSEVNTV